MRIEGTVCYKCLVWYICSGIPHDSKLSHLMRPPRVTDEGCMDLVYKPTFTATPFFPLGYLQKEKGRQFQKRNKTFINFQTGGYKSKNNTYNWPYVT